MKITNVVATISLKGPLDLEKLQTGLPGSEKGKSHWLKYRLQPENKYVAFYKSGKFLLTGADIIENSDSLIERIIEKIHEAGLPAELKKFDISNIVCHDKIQINSSLEAIYEQFRSGEDVDCEYEPEQFPGMVCKTRGVTILLFSTGSLVCTGAKTVSEAEEAIYNFSNLLSSL